MLLIRSMDVDIKRVAVDTRPRINARLKSLQPQKTRQNIVPPPRLPPRLRRENLPLHGTPRNKNLPRLSPSAIAPFHTMPSRRRTARSLTCTNSRRRRGNATRAQHYTTPRHGHQLPCNINLSKRNTRRKCDHTTVRLQFDLRRHGEMIRMVELRPRTRLVPRLNALNLHVT